MEEVGGEGVEVGRVDAREGTGARGGADEVGKARIVGGEVADEGGKVGRGGTRG